MSQAYHKIIAGTGSFVAIASASTKVLHVNIAASGGDVSLRVAGVADTTITIPDGTSKDYYGIDLATLEISSPADSSAIIAGSPRFV